MSSAYLRAASFAVLEAPSRLPGAKADVDFTRDVRPILPEECFRCHGPYQKARTSGLRLDEYAGAVEEREGERAIGPRAPAATELIALTKTDDPARRMPPGGRPPSGRRDQAIGQVDLRAPSTSAARPARSPNVRNCLRFLTTDRRAIQLTASS